jgi:hypothetical protein
LQHLRPAAVTPFQRLFVRRCRLVALAPTQTRVAIHSCGWAVRSTLSDLAALGSASFQAGEHSRRFSGSRLPFLRPSIRSTNGLCRNERGTPMACDHIGRHPVVPAPNPNSTISARKTARTNTGSSSGHSEWYSHLLANADLRPTLCLSLNTQSYIPYPTLLPPIDAWKCSQQLQGAAI